jgi:hypothetical protein
MALTSTEIERVERPDHWLITEEHTTGPGAAVILVHRTEQKPDPEEANRVALSDRLHAILPEALRLRSEGTDGEQALAEAVLLLHRFVHADYSDAEV